ncbi:MAG: hypothetical protein Q4D61_02165 [Cardiobacteriaceae bacterium]|nr:hypothetical protein [Cardiobacteriaceae bacterium]
MKLLFLALAFFRFAEPAPAPLDVPLGATLHAAADNPAPAASVDHKLYEYTPDEAVSISVRTELAHWFEQHLLEDAETKATLRTHLMDTDLVALLAPEVEKYGYPANSVASAVTLWFAVNYGIVHDVEVSDAAIRALYRQITALFATLPDFERGTDAEKQRMAEGLYWAAALQRHAYEQAKAGMPGYHLDAIAEESRRIMQRYGIDLDALQLTDEGVVRKGSK